MGTQVPHAKYIRENDSITALVRYSVELVLASRGSEKEINLKSEACLNTAFCRPG